MNAMRETKRSDGRPGAFVTNRRLFNRKRPLIRGDFESARRDFRAAFFECARPVRERFIRPPNFDEPN